MKYWKNNSSNDQSIEKQEDNAKKFIQ